MVFGEKPNIGTNLESEILTVRLFIESDGPMTSLPDDPPVVRMLLKNIDAGKKPRFTFNPEGWYEFEDRIYRPAISRTTTEAAAFPNVAVTKEAVP